MWRGKNGPCNCYFCEAGKPHPKNKYHAKWSQRGHLQVAESLNPKDILWTVMCETCTHEQEE